MHLPSLQYKSGTQSYTMGHSSLLVPEILDEYVSFEFSTSLKSLELLDDSFVGVGEQVCGPAV